MKNRAFLRLRDRNQITLPADVVTRFGLEPGDFVELIFSGERELKLRPAQIVSAGTAEAEAREKEAAEGMAGKESRMYSPEEFHRHLEKIEKAEIIENAPEEFSANSATTGKLPHKGMKAAPAREKIARNG